MSGRPFRLFCITAILLMITLGGCSNTSSPTYNRTNLAKSLSKILKDEYKIQNTVELIGQTLWIYVPLEENIVIEETNKPQEYTKLFEIKSIEGSYLYGVFNFSYHIKEIPEKKEKQTTKYNPKTFDKINQIIRSIRRILFSLERDGYEPKFFVNAIADMKTGVELIDINYAEDLKKASYEMISWVEYRHRTVEDIRYAPEAIGDVEGKHLTFYDIDMPRFIVEQIKQRLRFKFSQPEVKKGADIDREVLKTVRKVLQIYKFNDYLLIESLNLATNNRSALSRAALLEEIKE